MMTHRRSYDILSGRDRKPPTLFLAFGQERKALRNDVSSLPSAFCFKVARTGVAAAAVIAAAH